MTSRKRRNPRIRSFALRNVSARTSAGLAFYAAFSLAFAQDGPPTPEASIDLGLGYTDNLNRTADEQSSDIGRLAVGFAGRTERRWLRGAIAGDVEYLKYGADDVLDDDEVLGSVDAELKLNFVPERVQWDFDAGYGQVRIDPVGAVGPSNRQGTTSFSTGPQITFPLGGRSTLRLGGMISEQSFDETKDLDGRLTALRLGLERQLDTVTQLTIAVEADETKYDLDSRTYDIETLSLEYRRELASGEAYASVGRGRVKYDDISEPTTVARLVWKRAVGARSRIEFCAGREITDAGSLFAGSGVAIGCPGEFSSLASVARTTDNRIREVVATTNPMVRTGGSLSFQVDGELGSFRTTLSIAGDRFEEVSTFDNDSTILEVSGSREFARYWRAELSATRWVQDFRELGNKNEDRFIGLELSRILARGYRVSLSYEQIRRVGGVGPFDANEYFLTIGRDFRR